MGPKHILFCTDLSEGSLASLDGVAALARRMGARVTLLHVVEELLLSAGRGAGEPDAAPAAEARAFRVLEERRPADVDLRTAVVHGSDVPGAILDYAREHGVDLLALSTHGRKGLRHLALGSVTESVLQRAEVPVLSFPRGRA